MATGSRTSHLAPGDRVDGRYRIEARLGGGGMATVYRAIHEGLDRPVALKIVADEVKRVPGVADRFLREARATTRLRGEHVVRVLDVGTAEDGTPFMAMELLLGRDLDAVLAAEGPIPVAAAVDYALQTCEALAEVHGAGIVHRDLKPANLFLTRGPDGLPCVKLIDFGIARGDSALASRATVEGAIVGSPRYMAPEQMESAANADTRSDIWGMGVVLYELLTGEPAYDGVSYWDLYLAMMQGPPTRPSALRRDVPRALDAVVLRCLRPEPRDRWADVAVLAAALAPFTRSPERAVRVARVLAEAKGGAGARDAAIDDPPARAPGSRVQRKLALRPTAREARMQLVTWAALALAVVPAAVVGGRAFFRPHVAPAMTSAPIVVAPSVTTTGAATEPAANAPAPRPRTPTPARAPAPTPAPREETATPEPSSEAPAEPPPADELFEGPK